MKYIRRVDYSPATAVDDSNPYWTAMQETMNELYVLFITTFYKFKNIQHFDHYYVMGMELRKWNLGTKLQTFCG